jgi:hypothetical protein
MARRNPARRACRWTRRRSRSSSGCRTRAVGLRPGSDHRRGADPPAPRHGRGSAAAATMYSSGRPARGSPRACGASSMTRRKASGVISVVVGQPDPPQVAGWHDQLQRHDEVRTIVPSPVSRRTGSSGRRTKASTGMLPTLGFGRWVGSTWTSGTGAQEATQDGPAGDRSLGCEPAFVWRGPRQTMRPFPSRCPVALRTTVLGGSVPRRFPRSTMPAPKERQMRGPVTRWSTRRSSEASNKETSSLLLSPLERPSSSGELGLNLTQEPNLRRVLVEADLSRENLPEQASHSEAIRRKKTNPDLRKRFGGRWWDRTTDLRLVRAALSR